MASRDRQCCESCGFRTTQLIVAERLAAAVNILIRRNQLDARSLPGDALLDYYQAGGTQPEVPSEEGVQAAAGDRRVICFCCRKQVEKVERMFDVSTAEHILVAHCHGETDEVIRRSARSAMYEPVPRMPAYAFDGEQQRSALKAAADLLRENGLTVHADALDRDANRRG